MKYYDYDAIKRAVADVIDCRYLDHPNDGDELLARSTRDKQIDKLVSMISTITDTCYGCGMLEVQQGVIKALGLRHHLG